MRRVSEPDDIRIRLPVDSILIASDINAITAFIELMRLLTMPLRILTYNILLGGQDRLPRILALLRAEQPDVVALIEANVQEHVAALAEALQMPYAFGQANSDFHVAILSRLPIVQTVNHRQPIFTKTLLEVVVEWSREPLHLYATHLEAAPTLAGEERRLSEVQTILEVLRARTDSLQLLMGDFNALSPADSTSPPAPISDEAGQKAASLYQVPRLAIRELLAAGFVDCFRSVHPDQPGYTYPSNAPVVRIDYLFASPHLVPQLQTCEMICGDADATLASDHCPVAAEIAADRTGVLPADNPLLCRMTGFVLFYHIAF